MASKNHSAFVTLMLPKILEPVTGKTCFRLKAATIREALEGVYAEVPVLRQHLCVESGAFRPHVLCLLNDETTRVLGGLDVPLKEGDQIRIIQAISGG